MKRLTFICLLMVVCSSLFAQISTEEAKQRAASFLKAQNNGNTRRIQAIERDAMSVELANPSVYAVNVEGGGFVLVANSDLTDQILGYCDKGVFDTDDMPENMRAWLQSYDDQISHFKPYTGSGNGPRRVQVVAKTAINPLLKSKWGQGDYTKNKSGDAFNCQTPVYNSYHCPTGCVATAMAQVMYYHKYPTGYTTSIPSYNAGSYVGTLGGLSATTFSWSNMQDEYTGTDLTNVSTTKAKAVSTLMKYCGYAVEMQYQPRSSYASSGNIATALFNRFGYDSNIERIHRYDFTIADWEEVIYEELANKRPILYCGSSTGGGHEFVCDGYDGKGMFHINWGWNGKDDGYFLLTLLNPNDNSGAGASATSDGYTAMQEAVIGIQKPTGKATNLRLTATSISKDGSNLYISMYNKGVKSFDTYVGFCAIDSKNNITIPYSYSNVNELPPGSGFSSLSCPLTALANLNDGTYTVTGAYKVKGSSTWTPCYRNEAYYAVITVKSHAISSITLSKPAYSLAIQSVTINGNGEAKQQQEAQVRVKNNGDGEFDGTVIMTVDGASDLKIAGTSIPAKGSADLYFYFTPTTSGTHTLRFYYDDYTTVIGTKSVSIKSSSATGNYSATYAMNDIVDISGKHFITNTTTSGTIKVMNNTSSDLSESFTLGLYIHDGSSYNLDTSWTYSSIGMPAGGQKGLGIPEAYLNKGYKYKWELKTSTNKVVGSYEFTCPDGLLCYTADGTCTYQKSAASISLNSNLTSVDLTFASIPSNFTLNSSNPNCLYYLTTSQTTPTTLKNKNVVKGTTAETITLQSGYNFNAIKDFTAKKISLTTSFKGSDLKNGGWSTIVLPFTATSVSCNGKSLTWFKSESESGKNFWIHRFTYENNGKVVFDYVKENQISGHTPYIIAVPNDTWGSKYNLDGKDIVFSGTNVLIEGNKQAGISGKAFRMIGTFYTIKPTSGYNINSTGDRFVKFSTATNIPAFKAYFTAVNYSAGSPEYLPVEINGEEATGIGDINIEKNDLEDDAWYTLQGIRIDHPTQPGIYIHNGKKVRF